MAVTGNVPTSQFNRGAFPGTLPPLPGRLSVDRALLLQEGVPADARRDGAARGPPGLEDHGDRRPGPVVLDVPFDVFLESAAEEAPHAEGLERQYLEPLRRRPRRRGQGRRHAARRRTAGDDRRPRRALRRRADELLRLAERLQIPVASSASGLGAIDCHHPLALGLVARGGHYQANHATRQADVLLALGVRFDDRTSSSWIPGYSFTIPPTRLIHVDIDPEEIGRNYPGGARPDGRRAHLPAPGSCRTRSPRRPQQAPMPARNGWRRSTATARNGTSSSRPAFPTTPRRSIRSAPRWRSTRRCRKMPSWSAISACITTGC